MPELAVVERLQPCLLDRLTDDEPNNSQGKPFSTGYFAPTISAGCDARFAVAFGASAHLPQEGDQTFSIEDFPDAFKSVINFGTRHLFGLMGAEHA